MIITASVKYKEMLEKILVSSDICKFNDKRIMITGANGMIGSMLIDVLMLNNSRGGSCYVEAVVRNEQAAKERFAEYIEKGYLGITVHDVNNKFPEDTFVPDYIIHAASNTHPVAYAEDPVNTILANIYGTNNLLEMASKKKGCRFVFLSSVEVYGENRSDTDEFDESYCGYLNCNTLRAGYPESKRVGEALCQAYIKQSDVDSVIIRIPRSYGPTMKVTDSKASAQFILKCLNNEDIVLKSAGTQLFSYACVADDVSGILTVMSKGIKGEAYNLADRGSDVQLRDLAAIVAEISGRKVVFGESVDSEKQGASTVTKSVMCGDKLKNLGWAPEYNIRTGIKATIEILREIGVR